MIDGGRKMFGIKLSGTRKGLERAMLDDAAKASNPNVWCNWKLRVPGRKMKFLLMEKVTKVNLQPGATVCQSNRGGGKKTSTTAELAKRTHSRSGSWITIREFVKLLAVV